MDNLNAELNEILHSRYFTKEKREALLKLQEALSAVEEAGFSSTVDSQYLVEMEMDSPLTISDLLLTSVLLAKAELKDLSHSSL